MLTFHKINIILETFIEKHVSSVIGGTLFLTMFYIDRKFSLDERKIIEENLAKKGCTTAIYSCSYYLFIHKDPPTDSFRTEILKELRTILTGDSYFNVLKRLVNIDTKIMSSAEFSELLIEIYDFQIDVNPEGNFGILKHKIFDLDEVRELQLRAVSERLIELDNSTFIDRLRLVIQLLIWVFVTILIHHESVGLIIRLFEVIILSTMMFNRRFFRDNRLFELLVIICLILSDLVVYYFILDIFADLLLKTIVYCFYLYWLKQFRHRQNLLRVREELENLEKQKN